MRDLLPAYLLCHRQYRTMAARRRPPFAPRGHHCDWQYNVVQRSIQAAGCSQQVASDIALLSASGAPS